MVHHLKKITFYILLFSVLICNTYGKVYVWTDANGVRHYSNISFPSRGIVNTTEETAPRLPPGDRFKVLRVFDGDTLEAMGSGLTFKIRLVGIDTPETGRKGQKGQPYAQEAKQVLKEQVMGKPIRLKQYGTGGYNRILAEVFSEGRNINLHMVQTGMAEIYRGTRPSGLNSTAYKTAQKTAKRNRKGIWSLGKKYKSPRQWRKENPWK